MCLMPGMLVCGVKCSASVPCINLGPVLSVLWLCFAAVLVAEVVLVAEAVLHAWGMMPLSLEPNNEEEEEVVEEQEEVIVGAVRCCKAIHRAVSVPREDQKTVGPVDTVCMCTIAVLFAAYNPSNS